jgi:phosphatidylserine decarboxylase
MAEQTKPGLILKANVLKVGCPCTPATDGELELTVDATGQEFGCKGQERHLGPCKYCLQQLHQHLRAALALRGSAANICGLQYLVLTLGDAKEATPSISKTLNPEWNQTLELPITGMHSGLLEICCWDKDRFGKDYMGEFDVILEDVFQNGNPAQEPKWYPLESRRTGKKKAVVTGEILLQFSLVDPTNPSAAPAQIIQKFMGFTQSSPSPDDDEDDEALLRMESGENDNEEDEESSDEVQDESQKAEKREKRRKKLRLAKLRRKAKLRAYEFSDKTEVAGVLFLEIVKVTDLPPERNSKFKSLFYLFSANTNGSDANILRHGSVCCHLARQKDLPHESHQPQPQSGFRGETCLPGPPTRDELFDELHRPGSRQVLRE